MLCAGCAARTCSTISVSPRVPSKAASIVHTQPSGSQVSPASPYETPPIRILHPATR
jgi:hypothetical protein